MLLRKELVGIHEAYASQEEALLSIAKRFVDLGVVKESFPRAIVEREKVYPTGLPAQAYDIALSHCDSEHVIESAIGVSVLDEPVEFAMMGNLSEEPLHPRVIFMLAILDPSAQVPTLQKMMRVIQNVELLESIRNAETVDEVYELLERELDC